MLLIQRYSVKHLISSFILVMNSFIDGCSHGLWITSLSIGFNYESLSHPVLQSLVASRKQNCATLPMSLKLSHGLSMVISKMHSSGNVLWLDIKHTNYFKRIIKVKLELESSRKVLKPVSKNCTLKWHFR